MNYIKYPRTFHLPWSEGVKKDDKVLDNVKHFQNKRVVITAKMDGENTTLYKNYFHARSLDSQHHSSQSWIKNFHAKMKYKIPNNWRICGENLYAEHKIHYDNLLSYFLVFSIWNNKNMCISWTHTKKVAKYLNLELVSVLYDGLWDERTIEKIYGETYQGDECEGYVVRLHDEFAYDDFKNSCAKFVSKKFSDNINEKHWRDGPIIKNGLRVWE